MPFREPTSPGTTAYRRAVQATDDLVRHMRESEASSDPARALMASIFLQRHNVPFLATVHEAVTEIETPIVQDSSAVPSPPPSAAPE